MLMLGFSAQSSADSIPSDLRADTILVSVKHERKLYLLHDNYPLRSYRVALGLSPTGAKQRRWDFRTPERQLHHRFSPRAQPLLQGAAHLLPRPRGPEAIVRAAFERWRAYSPSSMASPINPPNPPPTTKHAIGPMAALRSPMKICRTCGI